MRILNREKLISHGNKKGRRDIVEIMEAGLSAADPYNSIYQLMSIEDGVLRFSNPDFQVQGDPKGGDAAYRLDEVDRIFFFGCGKGMHRVAEAIEEILGDRLEGGHLILKHGDEPHLSRIGVTFAGHPVPDQYCVEGCQRIIDMIEKIKLTERDLVLTCIGSGVSSLLTYPAAGLTIEEVMAVTQNMQIKLGMPTTDLSHIRNNIDGMKGGRITRMLRPARMVHMVTKDLNEGSDAQPGGYVGKVIGNNWLHTLPDATSCASALAVIEKWNAYDELPDAVIEYLQTVGNEHDTLSIEEFEAMDARLYMIMPGAKGFSYAARQKAEELGYKSTIMTHATTAEAAPVGVFMGSIASNCTQYNEPVQPPCCMIGLGELIVTVSDENGVGGRNQEYCLAAARRIAGNKRIVMAAADTDGTDGPGGFICEDAQAQGIDVLCGGVVDGYTADEAKEKGINLFEGLRTHGTSRPLWELDSGIVATHNISQLDLQITLIMDEDG